MAVTRRTGIVVALRKKSKYRDFRRLKTDISTRFSTVEGELGVAGFLVNYF
jgi:hypothetical protein